MSTNDQKVEFQCSLDGRQPEWCRETLRGSAVKIVYCAASFWGDLVRAESIAPTRGDKVRRGS